MYTAIILGSTPTDGHCVINVVPTRSGSAGASKPGWAALPGKDSTRPEWPRRQNFDKHERAIVMG